MNQKWIKYVAIAFALVLALGIISGIVNGGLAIIKAFGFFNNERVSHQEHNFNPHLEGDFDVLIIEIPIGDIHLQTGDQLTVTGNKSSSKLVTKLENKTLIIQSSGDPTTFFGFLDSNQSPQITITIPHTASLKKLEMNIGAGRGTLKGITCDELLIDQGAGKISATNINAKTGVLNGGAGTVSFKDSQLNDFDINGGVGRIDFQGILTGNTNLNAGVGEIYLSISGKLSDYFITANSGLGSIKANQKNIPADGLGLESSDHHIDIDGGIGMINLNFR